MEGVRRVSLVDLKVKKQNWDACMSLLGSSFPILLFCIISIAP